MLVLLSEPPPGPDDRHLPLVVVRFWGSPGPPPGRGFGGKTQHFCGFALSALVSARRLRVARCAAGPGQRKQQAAQTST